MLAYTYTSTTYVSPWLYVFIGLIVAVIVIRKVNIKRLKNSPTSKITAIRGKLINKVIDENDELRNVRNLRRYKYGMGKINEGTLRRYYITFETEKGIKSFTVSKDVYKKVKVNQKGLIKMKRNKFVAFNRDNIY